MKPLVLLAVLVLGVACSAGPNITNTNRGELKVTLPDAGMPAFQASHAFGNVKTGESSKLSFSVTNTGADPLNIRVVRIDTADTAAFFVQGGTGSVAPQVTRAFSVTFAPTRTGEHTGTLTFETDATAEPAKISLTGTGAAP